MDEEPETGSIVDWEYREPEDHEGEPHEGEYWPVITEWVLTDEPNLPEDPTP